MSDNVFTLDALREEVEREFAPIKVELGDGTEVTLRNILRLPRKTREEVLDSLHVLEEIDPNGESNSEEDFTRLIDAASTALELAAESHGKKLIKELDGDLTLTLRLLERWMKATQVGEASRSEG